MALSEAEVRHVARLARLELDEEEVARMTRELATVVGYVEQLQAVDTTGIEPVAQITGLVNVTRNDEPGPMLSTEAALANAPRANHEAFLVPKAVDR